MLKWWFGISFLNYRCVWVTLHTLLIAKNVCEKSLLLDFKQTLASSSICPFASLRFSCAEVWNIHEWWIDMLSGPSMIAEEISMNVLIHQSIFSDAKKQQKIALDSSWISIFLPEHALFFLLTNRIRTCSARTINKILNLN